MKRPRQQFIKKGFVGRQVQPNDDSRVIIPAIPASFKVQTIVVIKI